LAKELTLVGLKALAMTSIKIGTAPEALKAAVQWAEQAHEKIAGLEEGTDKPVAWRVTYNYGLTWSTFEYDPTGKLHGATDIEPLYTHSRKFTGEQKILAQFYGVRTLTELITAQAEHVVKLQVKLPPTLDFQPSNPRAA
jgi:hypothetical protein